MPYQVLEHTADIGLSVVARDLLSLFRDAAEGFFQLVTDVASLKKSPPVLSHDVEINFQEDNAEELLMHWLQELLFIFSVRHLVLVEYRFISLTPLMTKLKAKAIEFDPKRHVSRHEVKAVTHHQFYVRQTSGGWEARIIFDI